MESILHKASDRGYANHGWLKATHSFSFGNYYNSKKTHFGKLRVLNDDVIAPSMGFDLHPHQDMEIITIPLSGALRHGDNMGNKEVLTTGEVQVMSAGSGVWHSEHNASDSEILSLFQLWIFTDKKGYQPRYDQKMFSEKDRKDKWQLLVSPNGQKHSLRIHQNAFISMIESIELEKSAYLLNSTENGVYIMLVEGEATIEGMMLHKRDAIGFWDITNPLQINFLKNSRLLTIEIPMH